MKAATIALIAALLPAPAFAKSAQTPPALQAVVDELAVQRVPSEIEVAVDAKQWARARSFFADQVRVDFTSLVGGQPATIPADTLIAGWSSNLGPKKTSHHHRGQGIVTLNGDQATIYSQGYAWNKMDGNGDPLWEVWGNYEHELQRTTQGWKVVAMRFTATHQRGNLWVRDTPGQ